MKYRNIIFVMLGILISCSSMQKNDDYNHEIRTVLTYFINHVLSEASHDSLFLISPEFDKTLDSSFFSGIVSSDNIFRKKDVNSFLEQYLRIKNDHVKDYLYEKHHVNISAERPSNNEIYYIISPPLFTANKKYIIIQAKTIFFVAGNPKWDSLTFLLKNDPDKIEVLSYKK